MADITYTYRATEKRASPGTIAGKGDAFNLRCITTVITTATIVAQNATIFVARIPTNARLSNLSRVSWADLSDAASPTLDIGLASVDSNCTSLSTALSIDHALATVTLGGARMITDIGAAGKFAWELQGSTSDPKGFLDVYATVMDAATAISGLILFEVYFYFD